MGTFGILLQRGSRGNGAFVGFTGLDKIAFGRVPVPQRKKSRCVLLRGCANAGAWQNQQCCQQPYRSSRLVH